MGKFNSSWIDRSVIYREQVGVAGDCPHFVPYERPVIVCLCGSTRFKDAWYAVGKALTHAGRIVLSVGDLDTDESNRTRNVPISAELKAKLDELHKQKIDLADEVLVLNVGGYIGDSTRGEVRHAIAIGKTLIWLEPDKIPAEFADPNDGATKQAA